MNKKSLPITFLLIFINITISQLPETHPSSAENIKLEDQGFESINQFIPSSEPRNLMIKKQAALEDAELTQIEIKETNTVCNMSFIESFIYREFPKETHYIEFDKPNPYCPHIKRSCCTNDDIGDFVKSFKTSIPSIYSMYMGIYDVFKLYADKEELIQRYINNMDSNDIKCANVTPEEATKLLSHVIQFRDYRQDMMVDYFNFLVEYHSGLTCVLCNADMHTYIRIDDKPTVMMHGSQCYELLQQHIKFLTIELNLIKLVTLVKVLQCIIVKALSLFYKHLKTEQNVDFDNIKDCYTEKGSYIFELNEKCLLLCKSLGHFNLIKNQNNTFKLAVEARDFFNNVLFKGTGIITSKDITMNKLSNKVYQYMPRAPISFDDYNLVVDGNSGIYPRYDKMNIILNLESFSIILRVWGLISILIIFWL